MDHHRRRCARRSLASPSLAAAPRAELSGRWGQLNPPLIQGGFRFPWEGDLLVRIDAVAICATDLDVIANGPPALIQGGIALQQLWMFWVAPIIGAIIGGVFFRFLLEDEPESPNIEGRIPAADKA